MDIKRVGATHQGGSDSLVTSKLFFKILEQLGDQIDMESQRNNVHGLLDEFVEPNPQPSNSAYNNNNNNNFNKMMVIPPVFNPNYNPMPIHNSFMYEQNVNNFYKHNINVNNTFFNNFFAPQFDMMRFNPGYNGLNNESELNYISNGNIVTN